MKPRYMDIPGRKMWDYDYIKSRAPHSVETDTTQGQPSNRFWWAGGDAEQVSAYWYTYQSRWIPIAQFEGAKARDFAAALFDASRHWSLELQFNKGQSGASNEAIQHGKETSMNPAVFDAAALLIAAAGARAYPGVPGHEPNAKEGEAAKARVTASMKIIRDATPNAGTYVNEADYFEPNWQHEFWGPNYQRLLAIKQKYDPDGMFFCHHCVGSE